MAKGGQKLAVFAVGLAVGAAMTVGAIVLSRTSPYDGKKVVGGKTISYLETGGQLSRSWGNIGINEPLSYSEEMDFKEYVVSDSVMEGIYIWSSNKNLSENENFTETGNVMKSGNITNDIVDYEYINIEDGKKRMVMYSSVSPTGYEPEGWYWTGRIAKDTMEMPQPVNDSVRESAYEVNNHNRGK